eukprot:11167674-Lingulodinium_polyedra.AAC.1
MAQPCGQEAVGRRPRQSRFVASGVVGSARCCEAVIGDARFTARSSLVSARRVQPRMKALVRVRVGLT